MMNEDKRLNNWYGSVWEWLFDTSIRLRNNESIGVWYLSRDYCIMQECLVEGYD